MLVERLCSSHRSNCETVFVWWSQLSGRAQVTHASSPGLFQQLLIFHCLFSPHNINLSISAAARCFSYLNKAN